MASHQTSGAGGRKRRPTSYTHPLFQIRNYYSQTIRDGDALKHGCSLSLVLEREILAASQRHLGGSGGPSSRGGVSQSWTLIERFAASLGDFHRKDNLRKVCIYYFFSAFSFFETRKSSECVITDDAFV